MAKRRTKEAKQSKRGKTEGAAAVAKRPVKRTRPIRRISPWR
jgi:hypothetical protein